MTEDMPTGFVMDRELQRAMLLAMREVYPGSIYEYPAGARVISDVVLSNMFYLHQHGLCEASIQFGIDGHRSWGGAKITAAGLDFLEQDGGLTAILGVVTVKLHADTIRDLLAAKIDASDLPADKKSAMKEAIGKLPGTLLTAATGDLAKMGLEHAPGALHWIERLVSGLI